MIIQALISSFLLFPLLTAEMTFLPPKGWTIAPPDQNRTIGFIGPNRGGFAPSISYLETSLSIEPALFIQRVIERHNQKMDCHCIQLGSLVVGERKATLLQIDQKKAFGNVRIWQLILPVETKAYILTSVAKLEDFFEYQKSFEAAFASVKITSHLFEGQDEKKLVETALNLKKVKKMLKFLQKQHKNEGPFWQTQCLVHLQKEGYLTP